MEKINERLQWAFHKFLTCNNSSSENENYMFENGSNNRQSRLISFNAFFSVLFCLILFHTIRIKKKAICIQKNRIKHGPILFILSVLFFPMLPITILILTICAIMRFVVKLILISKFGEKLLGILDGGDAVWTMKDGKSSHTVNAVGIIQFRSNNPDEILSTIKQTIYTKIFENGNKFPKFLSTRHKFMGYSYLLKGQINIDEHIRIINNFPVNDENDLQLILSEYSNKSLPQNDTSLWEILVGPNPLIWKSPLNEPGVHKFPVIFRFHHSLGDGFSVINLLMNSIADNSSEIDCILNHLKQKECTQLASGKEKYFEMIKKVLQTIYTMFTFYTNMVQKIHMRRNDVSSFHVGKLNGEKILVFATEECEEFVHVVKKIKKKVLGVSFSDVMLTAISHSVENYFEKNFHYRTDFAATVIPALYPPPDPTNCGLTNNLTLGVLDLPVNCYNKSPRASLRYRLQEVSKQTNKLRNSSEYLMNYWLLSIVFRYVPEYLLKSTLDAIKTVMVVSNVPGCSKINIFKGHLLEDLIFFVPNRESNGLGFSVLTYDNKFQLGIIADKAVIPSKDEAQIIVDGIFKAIRLMDQELK